MLGVCSQEFSSQLTRPPMVVDYVTQPACLALSLLPRLLSVCFNFRVLLTDFASFKPTQLPAVSRLVSPGCTLH